MSDEDFDFADEVEMLLEIRELAKQINSSCPNDGKNMIGERIAAIIDDYLELEEGSNGTEASG